MNKKTIFIISVFVNIILALIFLVVGAEAVSELKFVYVEEDTMWPDSLRKDLERENYGDAAFLSRPIRCGAEVDENDMDYFMLGEYADLLFLKEIYAEAGNEQTLAACEERLNEIRTQMPEYEALFDKIEWSAQNAIYE